MNIIARATAIANATGFTGERWMREFLDAVDILSSK